MLLDAINLPFPSFKSRKAAVVALTMLAGLGAAAILYATRFGPWAFNDSVVYMVSARNMVHGRGLGVQLPGGGFQPTSGHPPLYPLSLALLMWMGLAELSAAQAINVLLFTLSILGISLGLIRLGWHPWLSLLTPLILFGHPGIFNLYLGAISEPPYLTFTLLGLVALVLFLVDERRVHWLWLSGLALGLAWVTRYAGLAGLTAAVGAALLLSVGTLKDRALRAGELLIAGSIPMLAWLTWLRVSSASGSLRSFLWDPGSFSTRFTQLRAALVDTAWGWIPFSDSLPPVPYRLRLAILSVLVLLATLAILWWVLRGRDQRGLPVVPRSALILAVQAWLFGVCYLLVLFFTVVFTDPIPNLDSRVLSPMLFAGLITVVCGVCLAAESIPSPKPLSMAAIALPVLLLLSPLTSTISLAASLHREGRGFTSARWRQSGVLKAITRLPESIEIVSNDPGPILFWTDRPAHLLPILEDPPSAASDVRPFGEGLQSGLVHRFNEGNAVLVLFDSLYWQLHPDYGDSTDRAIERLISDTRELSDEWDGTVLVSVHYRDH